VIKYIRKNIYLCTKFSNMSDTQVKSKERVQKHGEVFTPQWLVNDMLNLLPDNMWQVDKTFLEPACGEGAFLVEILKRKLDKIFENFDNINDKNLMEFEWQIVIATSAIYGIELLNDNIIESRKNLMKTLNNFFINNNLGKPDKHFLETITFLIDRNIVQGNALTCRKCSLECGNECINCDDIIFSQWKPLDNYQFRRKDFIYREIIKADEVRKAEIGGFFENQLTTKEYGLIKEYKPVYFKEIQYAED